MGGGTEAFPDLGRHCQLSDCHQLDFLPFTCHACQKVFCVEHRSCKSHECPKSDYNSRKVLVCEICSVSIETTGFQGEDDKAILQKHEKSGDCDPKKKKKPTCPVKRCKEVLTFSNTSTCKTCRIQVCLKHRFPADHACKRNSSTSQPLVKDRTEANNKFLTALAARSGNDCGNKNRASSSSPPTNPSVKAC
ncbi:zinc finger AN1 domain-containing stress-associated protein 12 [Lycium ferocissimum]|uniref:zinc finger AN1 domain-containing stress-associated protein 12 n=1 Tax=Lycium ferocissimum TaxID=112874 RepID=UPI002814A094|nr:zinc finger AN1 domain-containing stress-associated protein 12 [Lycium ferocissimum]